MKKQPKVKTVDAKWSELVKVRAGYLCEHCLCETTLNSHHIFGRKNYSTRWDLDNGICLCSYCHMFNSKFSAHETPTLFSDWVKKYRGEEWYDNLRRKANAPYDHDRTKAYEELKRIEKGKK